MNKYPDSTYLILTYKEFENRFLYDNVIDWAVEMLEYGYETENLMILAAISKPTNSFECKLYLQKALEELNLRTIEGADANIAVQWVLLNKIARGEKVRSNLILLTNELGYDVDEPISDFQLLSWAWTELEYDSHQYYIDTDVKLEDMEGLTIATAQEFIEMYRSKVDSLLP